MLTKPNARTLAEAANVAAMKVNRAHHRQRNEALISQMQPLLGRVWRQQARQFTTALASKKTLFTEAMRSDWQPDWDRISKVTQPLWQQFTMPLISQALDRGMEAQQDDLGDDAADLGITLDFKLSNPHAVAYLDNRQIKLGKDVDATTANEIDTIIKQATQEGWSSQQTANAITARFDQFSTPSPLQHIRSRAELIAVTEIGNAYVQGNVVVAKDLQDNGLTLQKSWLTVGDDRVDDECSGNEDAGWIDYDDSYPSGDDHPLAHPGCRCDELTRMVPATD